MADLGIYNYINAALARGETQEQITATLTKNGLNQQEIDAAFTAVKKKRPPTVSDEPVAEVRTRGGGGIILGFIILLVLVCCAVVGYLQYSGTINLPALQHKIAMPCMNPDACVLKDVSQIVTEAKALYSYSGGTYTTLCANGIVNVNAASGSSAAAMSINAGLSNAVNNIILVRGAASQQDAGISCGSRLDRFYIDAALTSASNYCIDSRGVATTSQPNPGSGFCGSVLSQI